MAYLNKIDINGRTYYLQHLTDGKNEAKLPTPEKNDELLLRSQVINSVTSKDSQNGWRVPLSAAQGYSLNTKLNQEILDREADVDEEQARAEAAEKVLTDNLAQEIIDRTNDVDEEQKRAEDAEKILTDNLNQEVQDRINDVDAEEARALAAEKVLTDNLAQEIVDRTNDVDEEQARAEAAEKILTDNLTQEIQDRADDVDAEEARALAAEKVLTDNLAQEVIDRTNAVTAEQSRAEGVESDHESRIATMETFFKEADIDASQEFIDTLKEIQTYIDEDKTGAAAMTASIRANEIAIQNEVDRASDAEVDLQIQINGKVDSVNGKGLSTNDYTDEEKEKLASVETGANKYIHPSYTTYTSGLYKITVDEFGHVSNVVDVSKDDIVGLGIPSQDTTYNNATTDTSGLLSSTDKTKYDSYAATIASLQQQIDELKALVESYHPVTETE